MISDNQNQSDKYLQNNPYGYENFTFPAVIILAKYTKLYASMKPYVL